MPQTPPSTPVLRPMFRMPPLLPRLDVPANNEPPIQVEGVFTNPRGTFFPMPNPNVPEEPDFNFYDANPEHSPNNR